jgi:ribose transport system substrate-binding protein
MSTEEAIVRTGLRIQNPVSRRVFMKLAALAGVAIPAASALGGSAWAADPTPKAATIVATLANDYWAAFIKGFKATAASLKFDTEDLYHDNDAARELAQVRALPTSGVNMLINTVVAAGEVPMVANLSGEQDLLRRAVGDPRLVHPVRRWRLLRVLQHRQLDPGGL